MPKGGKVTHGHSVGAVLSPEYIAWRSMKQRCTDTTRHNYHRYGGRGITYDPDWNSFEEFFKDVGPRPGPGYSLDRIDNNWHYEPGNVRWATKKQQANNRGDK